MSQWDFDRLVSFDGSPPLALGCYMSEVRPCRKTAGHKIGLIVWFGGGLALSGKVIGLVRLQHLDVAGAVVNQEWRVIDVGDAADVVRKGLRISDEWQDGRPWK